MISLTTLGALETLTAQYVAVGIDSATARRFACEFMRELNRQPPGTVWRLGNGHATLEVRR